MTMPQEMASPRSRFAGRRSSPHARFVEWTAVIAAFVFVSVIVVLPAGYLGGQPRSAALATSGQTLPLEVGAVPAPRTQGFAGAWAGRRGAGGG